MAETVKLAEVLRNGLVESEHFGIVVLAGKESYSSLGDENFYCFTRSLIKIIQAKVAKDILGDQLNEALLAISMSSHNSEAEQLTKVNELAKKFKLESSQLYCGTYRSPSYSLKSKLEHNCSGKHLALLAASKAKGWDLTSYHQLDHPIQVAIKLELEALLEAKINKGGIDGCGIPSFYLSLKQMAKIFQNLISKPDYQELIFCMRKYPELIGGKQQIDSLLMKHSDSLIAKTGAEGMLMISNLKRKEVVIVKVIDGSKRIKALLGEAIAHKLGWLKVELGLDHQIYNSRHDPIGTYAACDLELAP